MLRDMCQNLSWFNDPLQASFHIYEKFRKGLGFTDSDRHQTGKVLKEKNTGINRLKEKKRNKAKFGQPSKVLVYPRYSLRSIQLALSSSRYVVYVSFSFGTKLGTTPTQGGRQWKAGADGSWQRQLESWGDDPNKHFLVSLARKGLRMF
ncbi:hypothetical protein H5410_017878 [Solanum commersonii]|uniref:Uncharacterized protein n=1 Tax=Solanum commersonii TaxID=4109 RepID=A0A9J6A0B3_SOLCO|nr:hypothetical protein H5410_017878 [Solanum commersonii]